jgi:hypothetical protein
MLFYIIIFLSVGFISIIDLSKQKRYTKTLLWIYVAIFTFLGGARWQTGTDWLPYYNFFMDNHLLEEFLSREFEPGFAFLNYLVKLMTNSYTGLLFIQGFFVILLKTWSLYSFSEFPLISLFLNVSSYLDIFFTRQSVAIGIVLTSTYFIIRKQLIPFTCLILLAMTFHYTSVVFMPAYWFYYCNLNRKQLFLIIIPVIGLVQSGLFLQGLELIIQRLVGDEGIIAYKLLAYSENAQNNAAVEDLVWLSFLRRIFLLPILIWAKPYVEKHYQHYSGFLNLTFFGYIVFFFLVGFSQAVAARLSIYYFIYELFLIPSLLFLFKNLAVRLFIWAVIILYGLSKYFYAIYGYHDLYIPYIFFFENMSRNTW